MNQILDAKRKDGTVVKLILRKLTIEDIDQVMALQEEIVNNLYYS